MLPFPPDAAGAIDDPVENDVLKLYANYKWVARLIDEMLAEPVLDRKRAFMLVMHCREFRAWYEVIQKRIADGTHTTAQVLEVIEGHFAMKKARWERRQDVLPDLSRLSDDCGTIVDTIDANPEMSRYKEGYSINRVVALGVLTDDPIKDPKPAGLDELLSAPRGRFGAKP